MKIGLQIINFDWPGGSKDISSELEKLAKTAKRQVFIVSGFQIISLGLEGCGVLLKDLNLKDIALFPI